MHCRELGELTLLLLWHRLWSRLEQEVGVLELQGTGSHPREGLSLTPGLDIKHVYKAGRCWHRAGEAEALQSGGWEGTAHTLAPAAPGTELTLKPSLQGCCVTSMGGSYYWLALLLNLL